MRHAASRHQREVRAREAEGFSGETPLGLAAPRYRKANRLCHVRRWAKPKGLWRMGDADGRCRRWAMPMGPMARCAPAPASRRLAALY